MSSSLRRYAALLQPPAFDSPRKVRWHGASPGAPSNWVHRVQVAACGLILLSKPAARVQSRHVRRMGGALNVQSS